LLTCADQVATQPLQLHLPRHVVRILPAAQADHQAARPRPERPTRWRPVDDPGDKSDPGEQAACGREAEVL